MGHKTKPKAMSLEKEFVRTKWGFVEMRGNEKGEEAIIRCIIHMYVIVKKQNFSKFGL